MDEIFEEIEYAHGMGLTSIEVAIYRMDSMDIKSLMELCFNVELVSYAPGYSFYEISWSKDD